MGLYIEVENKLLWCINNGIFLHQGIDEPKIEYDETDSFVVCLVDNGAFYAVGVAYDKRELAVFKKPDGREKHWFLVDKELIKQNAPAWACYIEE